MSQIPHELLEEILIKRLSADFSNFNSVDSELSFFCTTISLSAVCRTFHDIVGKILRHQYSRALEEFHATERLMQEPDLDPRGDWISPDLDLMGDWTVAIPKLEKHHVSINTYRYRVATVSRAMEVLPIVTRKQGWEETVEKLGETFPFKACNEQVHFWRMKVHASGGK